MTEAALEIDGLSYGYGRGFALEDISFRIGKGEFTALLGPNGAGKTTLFSLITRLFEAPRGKIRVCGINLRDHPTRALAHMGVVFQQPTLLPWKTVEDNILVPVRARGGNRDEARARARELIALVKLSGFERNYPHELSGGMQQRVALARALMHDPPVLVVDEPFAALDALTREQMMLELQRLWSVAGKTVLFVTHSIQEAVFLSDRVVVLSPRPARITTDIEIALPRPRTLATMMEPAFATACDALRQELYRFQPA